MRAPMHPNAELIERFYQAFARRDAEAMKACYADDIVFTDEVFPHLVGPRAGAMWNMLCERANDLQITASEVSADDTTGGARWRALYTFSATGRHVENLVRASFTFRGGKIVRHVDSFDFWRWSRQALGPAGLLLGWSGALKRKVQGNAGKSLAAWESGKRQGERGP